MKAIEAVGTMDDHGHVVLDEPRPTHLTGRVRLLILPDEREPTEGEWLTAVTRSGALAFLHDQAEDVYALTDGAPFHDPR